ncbi:glycosyltransferase 87 family protein [Amycolatopsis sp. PS_44_ISF1]|uniref:glycosyltransferase 87 family protein n=1 Tax=Amycolatopsis sp. PS_44_ISF1 TaxID=2974917 RepID=UPI0028E074FA|nr:glycosyltransferase 87 family protein [Amycolatopsis sp. PS_44_ISF1]MDT8910144.1 glycosyltransferase 87 family protein [Amycolatopsis sp. PS_44_ISF1]
MSARPTFPPAGTRARRVRELAATLSPAHRVVLIAATVLGGVSTWHALAPSWQVPLPTATNLAEERLQDFRDALYFPVREFLSGGNPYDPAAMFAHWPVRQDFNLYQPYHLVLGTPFAVFGYRTGAVAFTVSGLLLLVALAALAAHAVRRFTRVPFVVTVAVVAALLVTSQVGKAQLYVGQVNPLIALGAAGVLLLREDRPGWASAALALAWLKPQYGFPLAVLVYARGSRRVALTGTAVAAAASLPAVVLLTVRSGGIGAFLDVVSRNLTHARATDYGAVDSLTAQRIDVAAVVFRVSGWIPPGAELVVLAAVLVLSALLVRRLDLAGAGPLADLLTGLAVVVCVVHQPGDVLIAVPAMTVVLVAMRRERGPAWFGVLALLVPFAHLHFVDSAVTAALGARAAVTLDGVAVVLAWGLVTFAAVRATGARATAGVTG